MYTLKKSLSFLLSLTLLSGCSTTVDGVSTSIPSATTAVSETTPSVDQPSSNTANASFDAFLEASFKDALTWDFTTLHAYYIDPANAGIDLDDVNVDLGIGFSQAEAETVALHNQEEYSIFNEFDRDTLSRSQQDLYDMYAFQMELDQQLSDPRYDYHGQLFSSLSGLHYNLTSFFSDYRLDDETDVVDLICLLNDTKRYVDSALDYTKDQAENGLLMTDMDDVLNYIQSVLDTADESAVLDAMVTNITNLDLDDEDHYITQVIDAFYDSFIPSYQAMYDTLSELAPLNHDGGYATLENGQSYYELLLKQSVGTDITVDQMKAEMEQAISNEMMKMITTISAYDDDLQLDAFINTMEMPRTDFESYEAILDYAEDHMDTVVPTISDLHYEIYDINEALASTSGVQAYFNIPPIDGATIQQMRVNPISSDLTSLDTYMTVCHEGYPGHMYQFAYMYENIDSNWQKFMANNLAYTEGYATYAQFGSMDFLPDLSEGFKQVYISNQLIVYYVIILADIAIHYDGMTMDEFGEMMRDYGLTMDSSSIEAQYKQLQANPCAFQSYYYGYYRINALRDKAMDTLGDAYDEVQFNTFILDHPNLSFDILDRDFDLWLNQQ